MDLPRPQDFRNLATALRERHADTVVLYLATAPALFSAAVEQLAGAGLNRPNTRVEC